MLYNIFFAAATSAAMVFPVALIAGVKLLEYNNALRNLIKVSGIVIDVNRVTGEVDGDIENISYNFQGSDYSKIYKHYGVPLQMNTEVEILVNPIQPAEIKILTQGHTKGYCIIIAIAWTQFFMVLLFLHK